MITFENPLDPGLLAGKHTLGGNFHPTEVVSV